MWRRLFNQFIPPLQRPFSEEVAREFRFSMARSSTRNFGAESALRLPPPPSPSQCLVPTKECRMAALAYAPCLPAVERESPPTGGPGSSGGAGGTGRSRSSESRRPSALEVARMHRRASFRKSSYKGNTASRQAPRTEVPVSTATSTNPAFASDSTRIPLPQQNGRCDPPDTNTLRPPGIAVPVTDVPRRYPPPSVPAPPIGFVVNSNGDPYPPPLGVPLVRNHGDIRVKKFTC